MYYFPVILPVIPQQDLLMIPGILTPIPDATLSVSTAPLFKLNPDFAVGIVMKGASVRQIWTPTAFRTGSIAYAMSRNEKRGRS